MRGSRRSFLKTAAMAAAAPVPQRRTAAAPQRPKFDPDFGTARDALAAMAAGAISSRELTAHVFRRIREHNGPINAFVTLAEERAMERARRADGERAAGRARGRLHGLPIVIKDAFETAGIRTTSGSKLFARHVPQRDAVAVSRLVSAGAIVVGKTNMPEFASDMQSYNEVAGTTNNPWDLARTPGGSTGGGAAALASGFGFLELGSDIGGSIRVPCHFCGIYGHKPSMDVVPLAGHIPPEPGAAAPVHDLPVAGPMARSAADVRLALEVLGGAPPEESRAWSWRLPPPRRARLRDYRLGYVLDDPFCPVTPEVRKALQTVIDGLRKEGVDLKEGWPEGVSTQETFDTYLPLLAAYVDLPEPALAPLRAQDKPWSHYGRMWMAGVQSSHREWLGRSEGRLRARQAWQRYFAERDAFLLPVGFLPAFPHDHALTFFERTLETSLGKRLYGDMLRWISFANLSGCPAAVAPAGRTAQGLPVGIQIMGPYLEDATPIDIAAKLEEVLGGFRRPLRFGG